MFKTKYSTIVILITLLFYAIIIGASIKIGWHQPLNFVSILSLLFILLIGILVYILSIKYFILTPNEVEIKKVIGQKVIALSAIKSVELIDYADLKIRLRLFGSGGVCGFYGLFYSMKFGKIKCYTTSLSSPLVLIVLNSGKQYVLSPIDAPAFVNQIKKIPSNEQK